MEKNIEDMQPNMIPVNIDALKNLIEEDGKRIDKKFKKLEKERDIAIRQYEKVVEQNKSLQSDLNKYETSIEKIKQIVKSEMKEWCYEDAFEDVEGCLICPENKCCKNYEILQTIEGKNANK